MINLKDLKSLSKNLKTFANFEGENELFKSVIYGIMFLKQESFHQLAGTRPNRDDTQEVLGGELFFDLIDIEPETSLDKTLFRFVDRS